MKAPLVEPNESTSPSASRLPLVGLLLVQLLVGYEWFVSGLTKFVHGGFPSGLANELREKSADAPNWYRSFLDGLIIPYASAFGYLIEIGELLVGLALIVAALVWPVADPQERLRRGHRPRQPAAGNPARPDRRQRRLPARATPRGRTRLRQPADRSKGAHMTASTVPCCFSSWPAH
jgi:hypothetical protein